MLRHTHRSRSSNHSSASLRWIALIAAFIMLAASLPVSIVSPPAASAQPDPERTFTLIIEKRECPPGFDPATADPNDLPSTCLLYSGMPITLTSDHPEYPGDTRTSGDAGEGRVAWTDLPVDATYTATEALPQGYAPPVVRCSVYADINNPSAGVSSIGVNASGASFSIFLGSDLDATLTTAFCRIYNLPPMQAAPENNPPPTAGSILLRKYSCVQRYDEEAISYQSLSETCTRGLPGIDFAVTVGNESAQDITTNSDGNASYDNYPGGPVTIVEQDSAWPHPIQPLVFCSVHMDGSSNGAEPPLANVQPDGRIDYDLQPGESLVCDWFNMFLHTGVQLLKLSCPEGINPNDSDLEYLKDQCTHQPGVSFEISSTGTNGGGSSSTLQTEEDGRVQPALFWLSNPSPTFETSIVETMPEGYVESRVYCSMARTGEYPDEATEVELTGPNTYEFEQPWESVIACAWFNFRPYQQNSEAPVDAGEEPDGYGHVVVQKYTCPETYPSGGSYDDFLAACANNVAGANYNFSVAVPAYNYESPQTTDSSGHAEWADVPAGEIGIVEGPVAGYQPEAVFCGTVPTGSSSEPGQFDPRQLTGSTVTYQLPADQILVCKWFNAPTEADPADALAVNIHKYVCPSGYDPSQEGDLDAIRAMCTDPQSGVTFGLEATGFPTSESQTDPNGDVSLAYYGGPGTLYEIPPPGYQTGAIWCSLFYPDSAEPYRSNTPRPDNRYEIYLGEQPQGSGVDCYWFNISNGEEPPITVNIHKFVCPADYDPYGANDADAALGMCTAPQSGVTFGLEEAASASTEAPTDESGNVSLPIYGVGGTLYEYPPAGYQTGAVYCSVDSGDGPQPYARASVVSDDRYPFNTDGLPSGTVIDCYWFNVPIDGEEAGVYTIEIYKLVCPSEYDPYGVNDIDAVRAMCVDPQSGVTFGIEEVGSDPVEYQTDETGLATIAYSGAEGSLYETPPPGYQTGAIYCGFEAGGPTSEYILVDLPSDNRLPIVADGLTPGATVICYWLNVPVLDEDNNDVEPGRIDIRKFVCPIGHDYSSSDLSALVDACGSSPHQNVEFSAEDGGTVNMTDSEGYASLSGLTPGTVLVEEAVPDGYRAMRVYCYAVDAGTGVSDFSAYQQVTLSEDSSISIEVLAGETVECYWFNEAYENEAGVVTIYKFLCADGYDPSMIDREYLLSYCEDPQPDVDYLASWNGGPDLPMTTSEVGYVRWQDGPGGDLRIQELKPPGYDILRIYCVAYDAMGNAPDAWQMMQPSGSGAIAYNLAAGYNLDCLWFNAAVDEVENEYGSITIHKLVCPDGYDPASYSRDYLASYCLDPHSGVEFDLEREDMPTESMTISTDGAAYWSSVPGGALELVEHAPDGYIAVGVYCDDYPMNGSPTDYQGMTILDGTSISYHLPDGYSLTCYWYNAPYENDPYGSVTITKYACPEGYDPHAISREYLVSWCMDPQTGVEFHLYREGGDSTPMTTSQSGEATWDEVYGGPLELREMAPEGYQTLRVYCATYPVGGQASQYDSLPVSDGVSVYYDLAPGSVLDCLWYDAPVDVGWIEVTKYACPEGYDPSSASSMSIADHCQQRIEGVEFSLEPYDGDDDSTSVTTDSMGVATFDQVSYDVFWNVTEHYPDGYNASVVYCARYVPHYGAMSVYEPYAVYDGAIAVSLSDGEYLTCRWYNLATPYGVDVKVTKYACPDDAWDASESDLAQMCDTPMPHVHFYLGNGDAQIGGTTSSSGEVGWEGASSGVVRIREVAPEGYGNRIRVYCTITTDAQRGMWESVAIQDGLGIEYGLSDGQTLECRWYNFPIVDTGAGVVVTKYLCDPNADLVSVARLSLKSRCVALAGVQFALATSGEPSWSRLTGHSGVAQWDAVPAGEFGLAERTTSGYRTPVVYCSLNDGHYERVIVSGGSIRYHVSETDELKCEWFNVPKAHVQGPVSGSPSSSGTGPGTVPIGQVPLGGNLGNPGGPTGPTGTNQGTGPATLTITSFLCPSGYDLDETESDPGADCEAGDEPSSFTLASWGDEETGEAITEIGTEPQLNVVTFTDVDAGDYVVALEPPVEPQIAWAFVLSCESSLGRADISRFYPLAVTGDDLSLRLTLYAGEELECGWYNVPTAGNEVMATVYECPGQVANPSRCALALEPVVLVFFPLDDDLETVNVETGEDGTATVELEPGVYAVEDQATTTCLVDSTSMDDAGNLIVNGDDAIEVVIYTCSG